MVAKYFGTLPAGPKVERLKRPAGGNEGEKRIRMTDRVELPRLYISWHRAGLRRRRRRAGSAGPHSGWQQDLAAVSLDLFTRSRSPRTWRPCKSARKSPACSRWWSPPGRATRWPSWKRPRWRRSAHSERAAHRRRGRPDRQFLAIATRPRAGTDRRVRRPGRPLNRYNVFTGDPGYLGKDFQRFLRGRSAGGDARGQEVSGPGRRGGGGGAGDGVVVHAGRAGRGGRLREKLAQEDICRSRAAIGPSQAAIDRGIMPQARRRAKIPACRRSIAAGSRTACKCMLVEKHQLPLVNLTWSFP